MFIIEVYTAVEVNLFYMVRVAHGNLVVRAPDGQSRGLGFNHPLTFQKWGLFINLLYCIYAR